MIAGRWAGGIIKSSLKISLYTETPLCRHSRTRKKVGSSSNKKKKKKEKKEKRKKGKGIPMSRRLWISGCLHIEPTEYTFYINVTNKSGTKIDRRTDVRTDREARERENFVLNAFVSRRMHKRLAAFAVAAGLTTSNGNTSFDNTFPRVFS